jgi:hypothetical protein
MLIETQAQKRFPKYESDMVDKNELTPDELVEQSHKFMKKFGATFEGSDFPNVIFFLDKSARPFSYTFRKLFPHYYPEEEAPQIRFINIQKRHQWGGSFNNNPEIIRKVYKPWLRKPERVCLIDECPNTGRTLQVGAEILLNAFPEIIIYKKSVYNSLPSWHIVEGHLGVRDLSWNDYQKMAIERLCEEDSKDIDKQIEEIEKIKGTIPYAMRSSKGKYLREYRKEQDLICQEILKFKQEEEKIS